MAIQLNGLFLQKKEFTFGNKTVVAEYTPEIDLEFGNVTLKLGNLMKGIEKSGLENAGLDEQQAELARIYGEVTRIASEYIIALFGEENGNELIEQAGNRAPILMSLAKTFHQAGLSDDIEKEQGRNREERRKG